MRKEAAFGYPFRIEDIELMDEKSGLNAGIQGITLAVGLTMGD